MQLHIVCVAAVLPPYGETEIAFIGPVRTASAIIASGRLLIVAIVTLWLSRMHNDPDITSILARKRTESLQHPANTLTADHIIGLVIDLVDRIDHEIGSAVLQNTEFCPLHDRV